MDTDRSVALDKVIIALAVACLVLAFCIDGLLMAGGI